MTLALGLREWLAAYAPDRGRFLLQLARNALDNQPPLGLVREFVLASGGEHPHTLDLKINGVQPFVEAARVYALACGAHGHQHAGAACGSGRGPRYSRAGGRRVVRSIPIHPGAAASIERSAEGPRRIRCTTTWIRPR